MDHIYMEKAHYKFFFIIIIIIIILTSNDSASLLLYQTMALRHCCTFLGNAIL